jgi:membrane protease YdiL (CAAX protease family)
VTIIVLFVLFCGALAVVVTAPLALFAASAAFDSEDASQSPLMHVGMLLFLIVPASAGWCVYQGWHAYKQGALDSAWHYGLYPALLLVVGIVALIVVVRSTAAHRADTASQAHLEDSSGADGRPHKHGHGHHHGHSHGHSHGHHDHQDNHPHE